ncbi:hypothetical protein LXL04_035764 [Taraxacum kok-saghyz]
MASMAKPILANFILPPTSLHFKTAQKAPSLPLRRKSNFSVLRASYEVGGGYTQEELDAREKGRSKPQTRADDSSTWSPAQYETLLKGGEQVTSVLEEMANLLEDDQMDDEKRKSLLEVIKETVLSHLTKKCPPHVSIHPLTVSPIYLVKLSKSWVCYAEPHEKKADMNSSGEWRQVAVHLKPPEVRVLALLMFIDLGCKKE